MAGGWRPAADVTSCRPTRPDAAGRHGIGMLDTMKNRTSGPDEVREKFGVTPKVVTCRRWPATRRQVPACWDCVTNGGE